MTKKAGFFEQPPFCRLSLPFHAGENMKTAHHKVPSALTQGGTLTMKLRSSHSWLALLPGVAILFSAIIPTAFAEAGAAAQPHSRTAAS